MEQKTKAIQNMFDNIAPKYDFLNDLLSFRRDVAWRKKAITTADIKAGQQVLDLACGTGKMIEEINNQVKGAYIIGGDFSVNMLSIAKNRIPDEQFAAVDAHCLPFQDSSFDRVTMAFGFRNVTDKPKGLSELYRVLKPNGKIIILELSEPENKIFGKIYRLYFKKFLPFVGGLISGKRSAYEYLPESVYNFPKRAAYKQMIMDAGFSSVNFKTLTGGIVTIAEINK